MSEKRIAELEGVLDATKREHELFRERANARLDQLRLVIDQEERENGAQVGTVGCPAFLPPLQQYTN